MLSEILGKQTKMPVIQARNEIKVMPNHVYLIPPRNNMVLHDDHLYLNEYDTTQVNHPIDIFFDSLAKEMGDRGVAVVLSGTGSDGTRGIKAVKEAGGLVIVQDPATAKFDGMPRSAIGTGLADFVLAPRQIVEEILNFSQHPSVLIASDNIELYDDDEAMLRIYGTLKQVCGVDFTHYKRSTVVRRIERRMVVTHSATLSDFASLLEIDEREAKALGREILIGVTRFFRDEESFQKLKYKAIYDILARTSERETIRVWVAGCSTGEEAYSVAIMFREAMDEQNIRRQVKIFATDVDMQSVEIASKGIYPESIVDDVPADRLMRFFEIRGESYHIVNEIREDDRVRAAQPVHRPAVRQARPHQLPQRDDLLPAGAAKDAVRHLPLRPQGRRLPVPGQKRVRQRRVGRVRAGVRHRAHLRASGRGQDARQRPDRLQRADPPDAHFGERGAARHPRGRRGCRQALFDVFGALPAAVGGHRREQPGRPLLRRLRALPVDLAGQGVVQHLQPGARGSEPGGIDRHQPLPRRREGGHLHRHRCAHRRRRAPCRHDGAAAVGVQPAAFGHDRPGVHRPFDPRRRGGRV